ncbi:MAG: PAS domain S-box protein, partial [Planctomycetes bacterium]|nr:PAS domain S-box protein [Planctomycetota bacterium]
RPHSHRHRRPRRISNHRTTTPATDSYFRRLKCYEFGNPAFFRILDWPQEELIGSHFIKVIPSDMHEFILERWREAQRGDGKPYEVDILTKEGHRRSLFVSHKDVDVRGRRKYCVVVKDVTERNKTEKALRRARDELEQRVRQRTAELTAANLALKKEIAERRKVQETLHLHEEMVTNMAEGTSLVRASDAAIVYVNPRFERMFEYEPGELLGREVAILNAPTEGKDPRETANEIIDSLTECGAWNGELLSITKNGRTFWCHANISRFESAEHGTVWLSIHEDITPRKETQQELRESEERFRQLAENVEEVFWLCSPDWTEVIYVSPAYEKVWGRSCESVRQNPRSWLDAVMEEDRGALIADLAGKAEGRVSEFRAPEYRIVRPDGSIRWILDRGFPIYDESGAVCRIAGIAQDITERRQYEETLRESESRWRSLLENMPDQMLLVDRDSIIQYVGHARDECIEDELIGTTGFQHIPPEYHKEIRRYHARPFETRETQAYEFPDNFGRWWSCRAVPLAKDGVVEQLMIICSDASERKEAQGKLEADAKLLRELLDLQEQERKLVAHEIHDGLVQDVVGAKMILEGGLRSIESQGWSGVDRLRPISDLLGKAISEGRRLVGELRPMIIDERGIVAAIEHLIAGKGFNPGLQVETAFSVKSDRLYPMLETTVFRIVQEALTNVKRHSQCDRAAVRLTENDGRLLLEIRDRGVGFDPRLVSEERFGLRGMRERARLCGGLFTVDSAPGDGTRIAVELPLRQEIPFGTDDASPA